jgi:GNAT superfamily N-acetyltransferase
MNTEPIVYPGPAEAPVIATVSLPWEVYRADLMKDWYALSALRLAAERRLREMRVEQWTDTARGLQQLAFFTEREEMHVVRDGASAIGCFALSSWPDPDFWGHDSEKDDCLYLYKVMIAPWMAGTGVGRFIINHALNEATERTCVALRLDCWRTNTRLHARWKELGFTHLRTFNIPGRNSGALMEIRLNQLEVTEGGQ